MFAKWIVKKAAQARVATAVDVCVDGLEEGIQGLFEEAAPNLTDTQLEKSAATLAEILKETVSQFRLTMPIQTNHADDNIPQPEGESE